VGFFLLRLIERRIQRIIVITLCTVNVIYGTCFLAEMVFQCIPISYFWERVTILGGGTCFNSNLGIQMTIGATVIAAVTDWVFALLPIWFLWNVRLSKQKKMVVCFLLGLGALASAAPIVRLPYLAGLLNNEDFLWATTDVAIWSVVELGIGIIVISLPACRTLFRSISFFATTTIASSNSTTLTPSSRSKNSWAGGRVLQNDKFHYKDMDPSIERSSKGYGGTFLIDVLNNGDIEKGIEKNRTPELPRE